MSRGLSLHEPGRESRRRPGVQRVGGVRGRERVFRAKVSSVLVEAPSEAGDGDWRERFGESVDEWEFGTAVTDKRRPGESSEVSHVGHDERERLSGVASARNVFSLEETEKDMRGTGNEGSAVSNGWFYSSFARQTGFVDVGNSNLRGRSIRQRDGICRLEQTKRVYAVL